MPDVTPDDQHCLVEKRGHVLIVTMNRPEARNALSGPMLAVMTRRVGPGRRRTRTSGSPS